MIAPFARILRKLDDYYLGWVSEELERQRQLAKDKRGFGKIFRRRK